MQVSYGHVLRREVSQKIKSALRDFSCPGTWGNAMNMNIWNSENRMEYYPVTPMTIGPSTRGVPSCAILSPTRVWREESSEGSEGWVWGRGVLCGIS